MSVFRLIRDGFLGFDIPWPERMVRISTVFLTGDPSTQDVPPGFIGQLWIDGCILGVIMGSILLGMVGGIVERLFRGRLETREAIFAYAFIGHL